LWQYFRLASKKAFELICAPKGIVPSAADHFSCKAALFKGAAMGAMGADHGPPAAGGCVCAGAGAEGHAPVVAVLGAGEENPDRTGGIP
jgi:hypothetical protein